MGRLSEWWFGRFSEDWQDLTTLRGVLGGVLSILTNGVVFALLLVLARLRENVALTFGLPGGALLQLGSTVIVSAAVGGGWLYLFQRSPRYRRWLRTFPGRTAVLLVFYGGFWLLLTYNATLAIWAAIAYMLGKGVTLAGLFLNGRS